MQTEWTLQNPQASAPLRVPTTVTVNTSTEQILANVLANSKRIKKWVKRAEAHDRVAVICGGGPSLADHLAKISELHTEGGVIFALNGAAGFLMRNGIEANYQVIMDAKPETASLIGEARDYLFASQVDPSCFDKVPGATLWHTTHGDLLVDQQDGFPEHHDDYFLCGGAVTVGNTSLALLYGLGYRNFKIFGMDSSHRDTNSHAYRQDMNAGDPCSIVDYKGKQYICSLPMKLQADAFIYRTRQMIGAGCRIEVCGDGLLPAMFNK